MGSVEKRTWVLSQPRARAGAPHTRPGLSVLLLCTREDRHPCCRATRLSQ